MLKRLFVTSILVLSAATAFAQFHAWEFGIMAGASNYAGDINNMFRNGSDDSKEWNQFESSFNFYNAHAMGGLIARYNFNPRWVFRGSLLFSKLSGDDKHFSNDRNLNFHSALQELAAVFEFNFLDYRTGSLQHRITPYIFGGLALFHFNPKTEIVDKNGQTVTLELHQMHTEGQGFYADKSNYHLWQISIPFGLGMKFSLSKYICVGIEWGFRKTFTDYIDDISSEYAGRNNIMYAVNENAARASDRTNELEGFEGVYHKEGEMRGNPTTNDWYNFFGITLTTKLSTGRTKCLKH
ncbi:MAG: outer membrane beta-barrel protein [Bacteroidales bacterium]|nr:outer membrane beta-barrel protein [Bacteroidales bacterium]